MTRRVFALLLTAVLLLSGTFSALGESGSYSQINQSLAPDDAWRRVVTDTSAFALGDVKPLEGEDGLFIGGWAPPCACPWPWNWRASGWAWRRET